MNKYKFVKQYSEYNLAFYYWISSICETKSEEPWIIDPLINYLGPIYQQKKRVLIKEFYLAVDKLEFAKKNKMEIWDDPNYPFEEIERIGAIFDLYCSKYNLGQCINLFYGPECVPHTFYSLLNKKVYLLEETDGTRQKDWQIFKPYIIMELSDFILIIEWLELMYKNIDTDLEEFEVEFDFPPYEYTELKQDLLAVEQMDILNAQNAAANEQNKS